MWWWIAAGVLVALELGTGTFYLLMLALGCAAGALAAHAGLSGVVQVTSAALLGAGATGAWTLKRQREPAPQPAASNADVNLDIGQRVHVQAWQADGTARVHYRGTGWSVRLAPGQAAAPGLFVIQAVQGNEFLVAAAAPH